MPYSLDTKTVIDLRMYPRFMFSKLSSECRYFGEETCARNIVPENRYFIESGPDSPMINDYASTDGSMQQTSDDSPTEPVAP